MEVNINQIINELREELKEKYPDFKGIYFFGSRKRGDSNPYSDYDMVFVFDKKIDWRFKEEIIKIVYKYDIEYDIILDTHVYNYNEILEPITPFRMNVKNEGIFYGA